MKCKKCGAEIQQDASFCVECGTPVEQVEEVAETNNTVDLPSEDVIAETTFQKGTMLGNITYKRVTTRVAVTESGLQIEKKTKKIFRKEKIEERIIPFVQIESAQEHTALDYWDTLYAAAFVILGFMFNLGFLLLAAVFFWTGYGKKIVLTLRNGEKFSIPYKFGKNESASLIALCNKNSKIG